MTSSARWFLLVFATFFSVLCLFNAAPAQAQTTIWSATLTVKNIQSGTLGCFNLSSDMGTRCSSTSALSDDDFTYDSVDYALTQIYLSSGQLHLLLNPATSASLKGEATFHVGSSQFPLADASVTNNLLPWSNTGLSWSVGDSVSLKLTVPPPPTVSLSVSPNPVLEGGFMAVTTTLSRTLSSDVRIPLTATPGSAESGDYTFFADFIDITAGERSGAALIGITTNQDDDADDETLTVALGTLPSSVTAGSPTSVTVTIQDDDKSVLSLSASSNSVTEGSSAVVLVNLSEPSTHDRLFLLTLERDTAEATDLLAEPWTETSRGGGHVFIIKNGRIGSFEIPTYQDDDTDDERFTVALDTTRYESMHGLQAGDPTSVTITIRDDDKEDDNGGGIVPPPPTNQPPPGPPTGGGPSPGGGGSPPATPSDPTPDSPRCGTDREDLKRFYEMTGGEGWGRDENWNSREPLGEWYGVETEDGNVVSLRLPDNNLSGDMPTTELLCLEDKELVELALWDNDDLLGDVPDELVLAVERAALREIAEMLNINPRWFENYEDPHNFENWHAGVTTDDDGRVIELDLTEEGVIGELPESVSQLRRLGEIMVTRSSGGCALSPKDDSSAFGLFLLTLVVFAVLGRKRARRD